MPEYLVSICKKWGFLRFILNFFLSVSLKHKTNAYETSSDWNLWSFFYCSFICDMFLKSKSPKSVRYTSLLLRIYFLLLNVSEMVWLVLQHLRIVCSKNYVHKWIQSRPSHDFGDQSVLLFSFNNCNFFSHVTHVQTDKKLELIDVVTKFIVELAVSCPVLTCDIWHPVNRSTFSTWLLNLAENINNILNQACISL